MKKSLRIIIFLFLLALLFNTRSFVFGSYEDEMNEEIKKLSSKISDNKRKIEEIQNKQEEYNRLIGQKRLEKDSLNNELSILNDQVARTNLEIEANQLEVDKTNLEIKKTNIDINDKNQEIEKEKGHISSLLRLLYKQEQASALEILLLNDSLTDFINQIKYLENTNKEVSDSLESLKNAKVRLEENKNLLVQKEEELKNLEAKLEEKKLALEKEEQDKNFLLEQTNQSEKQYQYLLTQAKKQQAQAEAEISSIEREIRKKIEEGKTQVELTYDGFVWPVTKTYITSTFHDPDYPFRRSLGEHSGVDIKASQGTTLRATASGYVARVKFDGSRNYAYIMIIHADGLSSVYGHVSSVSVKADDYVSQGQVIGKTGGMPGTTGAGPFSTGAHLHFEIRKNGIPVNPLDYLP